MKTWVIRFLFFIIIIVIAVLSMLSLLAGTSEAHRAGLERSFSDFLNADVSLGQLNKFNIMPQLNLETAQITGSFKESGNEFMLDRFDLAFSFPDLIFDRKRIENFRVENFRFAKESPINLRIDYIRINNSPALIAKGLYERKDFDLFIPLVKTGASRPSYAFPEDVTLSGHFGSMEIKGKLGEYKDRKKDAIAQIDFLAGGEPLIAGEAKKGSGDAYRFFIECRQKNRWNSEQLSDYQALTQMDIVVAGETCR